MKHIISIVFLWSLSIITSIGQNAEYVDGQVLIMTQGIDVQAEEVLHLNLEKGKKENIKSK
ncbi:MAG TPA: hypothetical protein EYQ86_04595 [Bacteroidetes bacterium]|nr:hypothetical protein [Bacteroidota bacterium]